MQYAVENQLIYNKCGKNQPYSNSKNRHNRSLNPIFELKSKQKIMKKVLGLCALAATMFVATPEASAQESFGNAGIELGLPMGDWAEDIYGFSFGVTGGYELGISDNFGVNIDAGYQLLTISDDASDIIANSALIPIQLGGRYYLDESRSGLFLEGKVGVHIWTVKTEDIDLGAFGGTIEGDNNSETYLSFAPQVGYFLNENISLALRYQMFFISEDEDAGTDSMTGSLLGLKAAYNF